MGINQATDTVQIMRLSRWLAAGFGCACDLLRLLRCRNPRRRARWSSVLRQLFGWHGGGENRRTRRSTSCSATARPCAIPFGVGRARQAMDRHRHDRRQASRAGLVASSRRQARQSQAAERHRGRLAAQSHGRGGDDAERREYAIHGTNRPARSAASCPMAASACTTRMCSISTAASAWEPRSSSPADLGLRIDDRRR